MRPRRIVFGILFLTYLCTLEKAKVSGGKSKTRSGLFAATQVKSGSNKNSGYNAEVEVTQKEKVIESKKNASSLKRLKLHLLEDYDGTLPPTTGATGNVHVNVGFTFRQILDLDEKNQVLKSLVWYHMTWKDKELSWDPKDFDGKQEIDLPQSLIWRPDIVVYEEIGVRDYSPRLQTFKVLSDGTVTYREPTVFETTCNIDTAFFPFDVQKCELTFVSWSDPVTKIDLTSDRSSEKLFLDTHKIFISTGEWKLARVTVTKSVADYGNILETLEPNHHKDEYKTLYDTHAQSHANESSTSSSYNTTSTSFEAAHLSGYVQLQHHKLHDEKYPMSPQELATYATMRNTSLKPSMFAEVKFTIIVRRNSSLYMQSMLFPSILLTTVAVLGFYLPPDSGERIGLQITILLTFMVFLLAVGEMFPASTGPYLGVYFVLCMCLLGINLTMTVLVLHLHFKPVTIHPNRHGNINKFQLETLRKRRWCGCKNEKGRKCAKHRYSNGKVSPIPESLRRILQFFDRYWSLREYNASWLHGDKERKTKDSSNFPSSEDDESQCGAIDDDGSSASSASPMRFKTWPSKACKKTEKSQQQENFSYLSVPDRTQPTSASEVQTPILSTEKTGSLEAPAYSPQSSPQRPTAPPIVRCLTIEDETKTSKRPSRSKIFEPCSSEGGVVAGQESTADRNLTEANPMKGSQEFDGNKRDSGIFRHKVADVLSDIKSYVKKNEMRRHKVSRSLIEKREERKRKKDRAIEQEEKEQEEWKSVARAIDTLCFRFYVILIIVSHVGLFTVALKSWFNDYNLLAD